MVCFSDEDSLAFSFDVFCIEKMSATVSFFILEVLLSGFQIRYEVASPHFVQSLTSLFISLKFRHRLSNFVLLGQWFGISINVLYQLFCGYQGHTSH